MKQARRRVARFALSTPTLIGAVVGTLLGTVPVALAADNVGGAGGAATPVLQDGPIEILGGTATAVGDYKTVVGLRIGGGICTGRNIHSGAVVSTIREGMARRNRGRVQRQ